MMPGVAEQGQHLLEPGGYYGRSVFSGIPCPGWNGMNQRPMGPYPLHTLTFLLLGEDVRITFGENSRTMVLTPFIFPLTIRAVLVLVLNFGLK